MTFYIKIYFSHKIIDRNSTYVRIVRKPLNSGKSSTTWWEQNSRTSQTPATRCLTSTISISSSAINSLPGWDQNYLEDEMDRECREKSSLFFVGVTVIACSMRRR